VSDRSRGREGKLKAKVCEQIGLVSAEADQCGYRAVSHRAFGEMVGLNEDAIFNGSPCRR